MGKGEIGHFEQFHLFPLCFPKAFFLQCVTMSIYGGKSQGLCLFPDGFGKLLLQQQFGKHNKRHCCTLFFIH